MKRYIKQNIVTIGTDNIELDSPTFQIVNINIDTVNNILNIEVLHEVNQGSIVQKHSRTFERGFAKLPVSVKMTGSEFLNAIESEMLKRTEYTGALEV